MYCTFDEDCNALTFQGKNFSTIKAIGSRMPDFTTNMDDGLELSNSNIK